MQLEPLKEDNLYTGDKPLEVILVPKCPLLRGFTVSLLLCYLNPLVNNVVHEKTFIETSFGTEKSEVISVVVIGAQRTILWA